MKIQQTRLLNHSAEEAPMEVAGIEPASENPSAKTSSIIVGYLKFPQQSASQQALSFGSF